MESDMFGRFLAASGLANLADGVALLVWVWVASLLTGPIRSVRRSMASS